MAAGSRAAREHSRPCPVCFGSMASKIVGYGAVLGIAFVLGACGAPGHAPRATSGLTAQKAPDERLEAHRGPPPRVTTAMPGEPSPDALDQGRLVFQDCAARIDAHREMVKKRVQEMRAALDEQFDDWWGTACEPMKDFGASGLGLSGIGEGGGGYGIGLGSVGTIGFGAGRALSASETNNQVAGVDEADMVKHDGAYVYVLSQGALRIIEALQPRAVSTTYLGGQPKQLLVSGDRLVTLVALGGSHAERCTYAYDCDVHGDGSRTEVKVFDIRDRARPKVVRTFTLSGSLIAARRIEQTVHIVAADNDEPDPETTTYIDHLPVCRNKQNAERVRARFEQLKRQNEDRIRTAKLKFPAIQEGSSTRTLCDVYKTPHGDGRAFTSIVSFDMTADDETPIAAVMQSKPGVVFASESGLYMAIRHLPQDARRSRSAESERSYVHKFRIGASMADTRYEGVGIVPGHVLNQFSMDAWQGYLRVATSQGRVPDPAVESSVSILASTDKGNLVRVGAVSHLAPSEDIRAVRFDEERAYVVTFKKTDPLFVLDLHDAASPKVLGELKIPGFSTYMHRIDERHLLSIGFDANDHGNFAYFDGLLLQLFDVTDPLVPVLLHKEKLGTRGSSSEAATDHLAFNYFRDKHLLAIPATLCAGGGDGRNGTEVSFSGLLVYDVTVDGGFRKLGGIDHARTGARCSAWWSRGASHVKRSIVLDDLVYSIAPDRVKVQRLGHLGTDVADLAWR